jgi:hypothetical protein
MNMNRTCFVLIKELKEISTYQITYYESTSTPVPLFTVFIINHYCINYKVLVQFTRIKDESEARFRHPSSIHTSTMLQLVKIYHTGNTGTVYLHFYCLLLLLCSITLTLTLTVVGNDYFPLTVLANGGNLHFYHFFLFSAFSAFLKIGKDLFIIHPLSLCPTDPMIARSIVI